jgi:hypothetical protein
MAAKKKTDKPMKKPTSFKGLLILKTRKQLPRGLKFESAGRLDETARWTVKGETYFEMPMHDFTFAAAKALGFKVA